MLGTMQAAYGRLTAVLEDPECEGLLRDDVGTEWVADKGYHSNGVMEAIASVGARSYVSEPNRGKRRWTDKERAKLATHENRRRLKRDKGKALMRKRGELIERSFAHTLESGAMRRAHLRGQANIMKRYNLHTAAFNLGLVLRSLIGFGTPKALAEGRLGSMAHIYEVVALLRRLLNFRPGNGAVFCSNLPEHAVSAKRFRNSWSRHCARHSSTAC